MNVFVWAKTMNRCVIFACILYDIIGLCWPFTVQSNVTSMNIQLRQSLKLFNKNLYIESHISIPLKNDGAPIPFPIYEIIYQLSMYTYIVYVLYSLVCLLNACVVVHHIAKHMNTTAAAVLMLKMIHITQSRVRVC